MGADCASIKACLRCLNQRILITGNRANIAIPFATKRVISGDKPVLRPCTKYIFFKTAKCY
ncbi:uncharacterized protein PHALS_14403 [Plasmopara halstedii]|uniref:Uncharacterized protein n=1 Tax=Plasmopara halstedii TaxID=4781 RepID=A0A0P1AS00_PLAHL|nr:uncharacterized protein PHALS_14403 [Plasmopara halstedii]CEG44142.1 hypothetical protein PHALS_14403 [Plasmopara halstedii]|eukprot:XP_024580511.1 hypothetical protein PHALS_14403 [Plasmopara halstedii]